MIYPEYKDNCIVNLISSIVEACDGKPIYPVQKGIDIDTLKHSENILLIVLDGFGYEFLSNQQPDSIFHKHLKQRMTSIFPSTTASAITAFATGMSTYEHALTGWFMYLKEIGASSVILPFMSRFYPVDYYTAGIRTEKILNYRGFFEDIKRESHIITKSFIKDSPYNNHSLVASQKHGYLTMRGFTNQIVKAVKSSNKKKYIYAYWPDFDKSSHRFGINGSETFEHYKMLDMEISKLADRLKGTDTQIIITADHGLLDTTPDKILHLNDFPQLQSMLSQPLAGEPRVPYCYVKSAKVKDFESYVNNEFAQYCQLFSAEELIETEIFGNQFENPKLRDRIGDYILMMKDNYVLHDFLEGENIFEFIGYHGNTTPEEMYTPLIMLQK